MPTIQYQEVTIANGASLSAEVDLRHHSLVAIQMPADWTAADLTFQGRPGADDTTPRINETLQNVYDDAGNEVTVQADADRYIALTAAVLDALTGLGRVKVRSGTSGTPVNQGAARVLTLVLAALD